jgi:TonB family protein
VKNAFKTQFQPAQPSFSDGSKAPPFTAPSRQSNFLFWIAMSFLAHIVLAALVALTLQILAFLGLDINLLDLKPKNKDVEFVLVDNAPKIPPKNPTKNRAEHASRSGGKKTTKNPSAMPQQAAGSRSPKSQSAPKTTPAPKPAPQKQATRPEPARKPAPRQAPQRQQQPVTEPQRKPTPQPPQKTPVHNVAPKAPAPKKVNFNKASDNNVPESPKSPMAPTIRTPASGSRSTTRGGGPVVKTPSFSSSPSGGSSGSSGSSGNPGPSMISGSPSRSHGQNGSGGQGGGQGAYNQSGSPGGGGGRAGIDASAEPDFGPYIAELQRRIRRNWSPPVEDRSKRVVAYFVIGQDGRLLSLRIERSSGSVAADNAALAAVRASAPFRQLPENFRGSSIPVQFIFDYETTGHGTATKMR